MFWMEIYWNRHRFKSLLGEFGNGYNMVILGHFHLIEYIECIFKSDKYNSDLVGWVKYLYKKGTEIITSQIDY